MSDNVGAVVTIGGFTDNVEGSVACALDASGNPYPVGPNNRLPVGDMETDIALGRVTGRRFVNKFGRNQSIDTGTLPEDLWQGGGVYTGFPTTGSAETLSIFSSDAADSSSGTGARTLIVTGLDANYNEISETVTLNGTTPVTTTQAFWRMHTANVRTAGSNIFNVGQITIRHTTTTANVFAVMLTGRNQTNVAAYTVPAGFTGIFHRIYVFIRSANAARYADGELWVRQFGLAPRLRRPWTVNSNAPYYSDIMGGIILPEKTDIMLRVSGVSNTGTDVIGEYDLEIVPNL